MKSVSWQVCFPLLLLLFSGLAASPSSPSPVLVTLPGRLEVESYQAGGEAVAYHDTTSSNLGGACRPTEGVDIGSPGQCVLSWTVAGEWVDYDVDLTPGTYDVTIRHSSALASGGSLQLELDGMAITPVLQTWSTGGWSAYEDLIVRGLALPAGLHELRLMIVQGGFNLDYIEFTLPGVTSDPIRRSDTNGDGVVDLSDVVYLIMYLHETGPPGPCLNALDSNDDGAIDLADPCYLLTSLFTAWNGIPSGHCQPDPTPGDLGCVSSGCDAPNGLPVHVVPGRIEAEDYRDGGFYDTTSSNLGSLPCGPGPVDVCQVPGEGCVLCWTATGEWLDYCLDVAQGGQYDVQLRVASGLSNGGSLHLELNGVDLTGTVPLPGTGGWTNYQTINLPGVTPAKTHP